MDLDSFAAVNGYVRLLHLDDDKEFLELSRDMLSVTDPVLNVEEHTSPIHALEALKRNQFDCVVSDYQMPEMDGIEFSRKLREFSDVPIILYTGKGSEEVAEAAFQVGVSDYIRKEANPSHYQVLAKRIRLAVEARWSERLYKNIADSSTDGCSIKDGTIFVYANQALADILGVADPKELLGTDTRVWDLPEHTSIIQARQEARLAGIPLSKYLDYSIRRRDGEIRRIETASTVITYRGRRALLSFTRDVTERYKLLDFVSTANQRYVSLFSNMPEAYADHEIIRDESGAPVDFRFLEVNEAFCNLVGLPSERIISLRASEVLRPIDPLYVELLGSYGEVASGGQPQALEHQAKGTERWLYIKVFSWRKDHFVTLVEEITKRKRMEDALRGSEVFYRTVLDNTSNPMLVTLRSEIIYANSQAAHLLKADAPNEVIGRSLLDYLHPLDPRDTQPYQEASASAVHPFSYTALLRNVENSPEIDVSSTPITWEGRVAGLNILSNISESKDYQRKIETLHMSAKGLAEASTRGQVWEKGYQALRRIISFTWGGIAEVIDDRIVYVRDANYRAPLGSSVRVGQKSVTGRVVLSGVSQLVPDVRKDPDFISTPSITKSQPVLSELAVPLKEEERTVALINIESTNANEYTREDQRLLEVLAMHMGAALTRIKKIEELQSSEEKYRSLLESSQDSAIVMTGTTIVYANPRGALNLGVSSPTELIGRDITEYISPEKREAMASQALARQRGEKQPDRFEDMRVRPDGRPIYTEVTASRIFWEGKPATLTFGRDITERKLNEEKITALHSHAAALQNANTVDEVLSVTLEAMKQAFGYTNLQIALTEGDELVLARELGKSPFKRLPLAGKGISVKAARTRKTVVITDTRNDPDYLTGGIDALSELATPILVGEEVFGVINVESERLNVFTETDVRLMETLVMHVASTIDRLRAREIKERDQAARTRELLDGAGRVANMVAHDLRSPLQTIVNAVRIQRIQPGRVEEMAKTIEGNVEYAKRILDDLKYTTSPSELDKRKTDIQKLLTDDLDSTVFPTNVRVKKRFIGENLECAVDPIRMRRVFDNIIKNAVEAMPEGGDLTVGVSRVEGGVEVSIRDTGTGIPEDILSHLFEPFNTTKRTGTGLGLTYAKQAVEAHGGSISVDTEVGGGTIFTIFIPRMDTE